MKKKMVNKKSLDVPQAKWAEEKIRESEKIVEKIHQQDVFASKLTFWTSLIVVVFGNILISVALIPFLAVLNRWFLDLIIIIIALMMGFIFNFLIMNVGHLERKHHILAVILVPLTAVFNVVVAVILANQLIEQIQIPNIRESPLFIGVLYGAAFVLPYLYSLVRKKR